MGAFIEVRDVTKVYRGQGVETEALHGVSLGIEKGEMVAIVGPSGSGKSTLMAILGCLDRPTSGRYLLDGKDVTLLDDDELSAIRNRLIGFVFQQFNLLPRQSALENVELPQVYAGVPRARRRNRAAHMLRRMGLGNRLHNRPSALSGGEMQRVAIARALVNEPRIILADEPTGNLDSASGHQVMGIFRELNREGTTVVIVTHDPSVAKACERMIEILDGRVVGDHSGG